MNQLHKANISKKQTKKTTKITVTAVECFSVSCSEKQTHLSKSISEPRDKITFLTHGLTDLLSKQEFQIKISR